MPSATFRRAMTVGALTAAVTLALIPQATADAGDEDIVRMRFAGVMADSSIDMFVEPGDSWTTYLNLYTPENEFAGDASSRCTAVEAQGNRLTAQCTRVLRLEQGEITLHDMITHEANMPITAKTSIAGGTGLYNDAEGEGYITLAGDRVLFDLYVDD